MRIDGPAAVDGKGRPRCFATWSSSPRRIECGKRKISLLPSVPAEGVFSLYAKATRSMQAVKNTRLVMRRAQSSHVLVP